MCVISGEVKPCSPSKIDGEPVLSQGSAKNIAEIEISISPSQFQTCPASSTKAMEIVSRIYTKSFMFLFKDCTKIISKLCINAWYSH